MWEFYPEYTCRWTLFHIRLHLVVKIMHKLCLKYCLVLKVQACTSNSFRAFYDIVLPGFFPCQLIAIENQNQLFTTSQRLIQKNCIVQLELKLKFDWHMLCRERREISLTVLWVNFHDVTGRIFNRWVSRQTGTKSPLKRHNQPGKK